MDFIPKGMEIIKQAVTADNNDELESALSLYRQGLNYFVTGLKYIKNDASKQAIRERMDQYMTRAEQIKEALDKREAKKSSTSLKSKASKSGGSGSEGKGKEGGGKDKGKKGKK